MTFTSATRQTRQVTPRARLARATRSWSRACWPLPPGVALFLFVLSLYLLTAGGHTYSYDEETMFALTESLVERGSIVIPTCTGCPILHVSPMRNGVNYSRYGPLQSLAAAPFYVAGRALAADSEPARWVLTRFAVTLLNAVATAGVATLLYRFARDLGYGARPALATGLLYATGTQAWPHARTFASEPLTALLLFGAVYCWWRLGRAASEKEHGIPVRGAGARRSAAWAAGIGAGCGLAIATKVGAGIALPVLALATAVTLWRLRRTGEVSAREALVSGASAAAALAVPLALVGWYNLTRFGSPFETGYSAREVGTIQGGDFWLGLRGLLISPGKSLFVFSPVVALSAPAWLPFVRRHRGLGLVALALTLVHLLFYARVPYWHGDVTWGPRYIDFVLPLLVLPLATGLEWVGAQVGIRRWVTLATLTVTIVAAVLVQALGVLVNFDTGFNAVTTGNRYFHARNAPVLVHARILRGCVTAWREARFPRQPGITPQRGFAVLTERDPLWPRFLPREATLRVHTDSDGPLIGTLVYQDARERREPPQRLTILVDGRPVIDQVETPAPDADEPAAYRITFTIQREASRGGDALVTIRNDTYTELGPNRLLAFGVSAAGVELPARRRPLILPFPGNTPERFAWFLTERNRHLVDLWPWYLTVLRLPVGLSWSLGAGLGGGAALGLAVGAVGLAHAVRGTAGPTAPPPAPKRGERLRAGHPGVGSQTVPGGPRRGEQAPHRQARRRRGSGPIG